MCRDVLNNAFRNLNWMLWVTCSSQEVGLMKFVVEGSVRGRGRRWEGGERASGEGSHGWRGPGRVAEMKRRWFS